MVEMSQLWRDKQIGKDEELREKAKHASAVARKKYEAQRKDKNRLDKRNTEQCECES